MYFPLSVRVSFFHESLMTGFRFLLVWNIIPYKGLEWKEIVYASYGLVTVHIIHL